MSQPHFQTDRDKLLPTHANRFVAHMTFRRLAAIGMDAPNGHSITDTKAKIPTIVRDTLTELAVATNSLYPNSYLAAMFKNVQKCKALAAELTKPQPSAAQS